MGTRVEKFLAHQKRYVHQNGFKRDFMFSINDLFLSLHAHTHLTAYTTCMIQRKLLVSEALGTENLKCRHSKKFAYILPEVSALSSQFSDASMLLLRVRMFDLN